MLDFIPLDTMPLYNDCKPLIDGLGYSLVEIRQGHTKSQYQIRIVITRSEPNTTININDCAKVHRLLLPRLEALLKTQEVLMEVTSPGSERTIKNAAEIPLFAGRTIRIWHIDISDWITGTIITSSKDTVTLKINEVEERIPLLKIAKAKLNNL